MDRVDHPIATDPPLRSIPLSAGNLPRLGVLALLRAYQMTFSRLIPVDTCRFYPTWSHYGYQAVAKYGLVLAGRRLAVLLSACSGALPSTSWPGLSASATTAYLADGQYTFAIDLQNGTLRWRYPDKAAAGASR